jgi:CheY-like chemotaxis protein
VDRVLIVEDESPLRRILMLNLSRRGYDVAEAGTAAEAIELLDATDRAFDLLLLDINLPDQSGWDVLRYLATRQPAPADTTKPIRPVPRVIVITAVHPGQRRLDEFRPAAVLLKPFPIEALLRLITRVLTGAALREEVGEDPPSGTPAISALENT